MGILIPPLSIMDTLSRQKLNQERVDLKKIIDRSFSLAQIKYFSVTSDKCLKSSVYYLYYMDLQKLFKWVNFSPLNYVSSQLVSEKCVETKWKTGIKETYSAWLKITPPLLTVLKSTMFRLRCTNLYIKSLKYFFIFIICKIIILLSNRKYNYLRIFPLRTTL